MLLAVSTVADNFAAAKGVEYVVRYLAVPTGDWQIVDCCIVGSQSSHHTAAAVVALIGCYTDCFLTVSAFSYICMSMLGAHF